MDISIVVPLLNEEESIQELYDWIARVMRSNHFSYEILFVDDGSTDGSIDRLESLVHDARMRVVRQANAGKPAAMNRAIDEARGA